MQLFCDALKVLAKNSMVAFLDLVSAVLEESRSRDSVEIRGVDKNTSNIVESSCFHFR